MSKETWNFANAIKRDNFKMKCMQKHSGYVGEPNNNQSESGKYPDQSPPQSKIYK